MIWLNPFYFDRPTANRFPTIASALPGIPPRAEPVDARDAVFASLRLWRDANHDGVSRPSEPHALASLGVMRLHLDYRESQRVDEHGNRFRYRAKVDDAKGSRVNRWAWDVFLVREP